MDGLAQNFQEALESLDKVRAFDLFQQALSERSPIQVVEEIVVPALEQIGLGWQDGRLALSQIYLSGRICEDLVDKVLPPSDPDRKHQPRHRRDQRHLPRHHGTPRPHEVNPESPGQRYHNGEKEKHGQCAPANRMSVGLISRKTRSG